MDEQDDSPDSHPRWLNPILVVVSYSLIGAAALVLWPCLILCSLYDHLRKLAAYVRRAEDAIRIPPPHEPAPQVTVESRRDIPEQVLDQVA